MGGHVDLLAPCLGSSPDSPSPTGQEPSEGLDLLTDLLPDGRAEGVERLDVCSVPESADAWSSAAPLLTARAEMGVASTGGRIYTVGGLPALGVTSDANEVFKP